jgi:hypothetical protein
VRICKPSPHAARGSLAVLLLIVGCAAPIVPQRAKPGGSARWAEALALRKAHSWAPDAALCRIDGLGVGSDGWLPDRGGSWRLHYWSAAHEPVLEIAVDSDGGLRVQELGEAPERGRSLPATWADSPKAWAATRFHQAVEPMHTFDAELAADAEPQRFPGEVVWRIRFWLPDGTYETHVVTAGGTWRASY